MNRFHLLVAASAFGLAAAPAASQPISQRDSFPIGSGGGVVCSAQASGLDAAFGDMFDRGYAITCRDAAAQIGTLYALRLRGGDPAARLAQLRERRVLCDPRPRAAAVADLPGVQFLSCRLREGAVDYRVYLQQSRGTLYVAEGLAGYDSALQLGLRALVADRPLDGEVSVATTGAGDPVAFARAQAGSLDPRRALAEAYRRNNAGNYAESGEFFASLIAIEESATRAEALANQALQSSNLGRYPEAEALFARAAALGGNDPVLRRRLRNYTALHLLNQGQADAALRELDRPIDAMDASMVASGPVIGADLAQRLNVEAAGRAALDRASGTLTAAEKIQILDGQALQLRGTIRRIAGDAAGADPMLRQAAADLQSVRGGVVASTLWMRAQIMAELAEIAEGRRDAAGAEQLYRDAVTLLEVDYPASAALLSAQARLASFYGRSGRMAEALTLYRQIVASNVETGTGSSVVRRALEPYFTLLTGAGLPAGAAADLFLASQVAQRPGVAQTTAVLARELSEGSDAGSRLFRQSVALTRDVESIRVRIARLQALPPTGETARMAADLQAELARSQAAQVATQARLADYPRYRAVAANAITLAELQQTLHAGEAYYKLTALGRSVYGLLVTRDGARAFRTDLTPDQLEQQVDTVRATISLLEDGQIVTYPFDVATAHGLYRSLFGPVAAELANVHHLIFEPDGAMLRLPPNVLVEDEASVAAHAARAADPDDEGFNFTGIAWFGRSREISTAVSPRAFRDVRAAAPSQAPNEYLGLGQNAPVGPVTLASANVRSADGDGCGWALTAWNQPISAAELLTARQAIGRSASAGGTDILTGAAFTDTAILQRRDLDQFRVMHFATHGLVTPPRPECPARPSLMTSFGGEGSDGLLSFREIFDLRLDADLIILSACDTAGRADFRATQEAGLTTGGDFALDGLVRAFVGAGGRMVVASHWPVPEAYDATQRLISGLFTAPPGTGTAAALLAAQRQMMDQAPTSHPYYWAGFAIIGDGVAPVVRSRPQRLAAAP